MKNYDWKKHASQVVRDDSSIERAFMDQAYQFLANKGGALLKDPYRLGFEIVYKNDNNTRMVGIFAFRVGNNLLYVPTFFLNGEIKGTDLLYRHDSKTFVPLEDQWVKYIINKASRNMGRGTDKHMFTSPKSLNLDDLAYPPGMGSGSVKGASEKSAGSLIKKFIIEDGGYEAIRKLASWMDSSWDFAKEFTNKIPQSCFMPTELYAKEVKLKKQASKNTPQSKLLVSVGDITKLKGIPADQIKSAAAQFIKHGYNLWDTRESDDIKPVYTSMDKELTEVGEEPGYWKVLLHDGSTQKAFVAKQTEASWGDGGKGLGIKATSIFASKGPAAKTIIFTDGKVVETYTGEVAFGEPVHDQRTSVKKLDTTASPGSAYMVFDAESGTLTRPIFVISKSRDAGLDHYVVRERYGDPFTISRNPDAQYTDISKGMLNANAYFLRVKIKPRKDDTLTFELIKPDKYLGKEDTMMQWCLDYGVKKATIRCDNSDYTLYHNFRKQTRPMNRVSMAIKLASQLSIHAKNVEELLDRATEEGSFTFFYGNPGDTMREKSATMVRLDGQPDFRTYHDDEFDVDVEEPQRFWLGSHTDQDEIPQQRVGDSFDSSMGLGGLPQQDGEGLPIDKVLSYTPEQLAQLSMNDDVPQIFEHGVVGSLAQTYDAISMIDKYVPDMEKALDKLGRILFLFYWKPRDFEFAYGTDDMSNMENKLLSNFKSFGELTLNLIKKSESLRKGTVSLAGE